MSDGNIVMTIAQAGTVIIGRNEGNRLRECLKSLYEIFGRETSEAVEVLVIYVDSGSTDGSVELAKSFGSEVVSLDESLPFSAARARNDGFWRLLQLFPETQFVQFVDGDCEVVTGWVEAAANFLTAYSE